ncbi:MAG TPA: hypothetical protein VN258_20690 [Mobilitalea sp.]|nr:hypothetical protein [Mobilitalea sp.]
MILLLKRKIKIWFYIGITAILCIPAHIITNYVVDVYTHSLHSYSSMVSTVSSVIALMTIAGISIVIGLARRNPTYTDR